MKKFKITRFAMTLLVLVFAFSLSNCRVQVGTDRATYKAKRIPPGHAKKMHGDKSAKNYAPGHNK